MERTAPRRAVSAFNIPPQPVQQVWGRLDRGSDMSVVPDNAADSCVPDPEGVPPRLPMTTEEGHRLRAFLKERKIETLIHFTRLENLTSILTYGLYARTAIENDTRIGRVCWNEPELPVAWRSMISFNISYPNYRLFYKLQAQRGYEWIVLVYDAALLLQLPFYSFTFPAANLIRTPIFQSDIAPFLQTFDAFEALFLDTETVRRKLLQIPDSYPTHPHSEILIPETVPNTYLKEVHFYNEYKFEQWCVQNQAMASIVDKNLWQVGLTYFSPRMDYANWRTTIR